MIFKLSQEQIDKLRNTLQQLVNTMGYENVDNIKITSPDESSQHFSANIYFDMGGSDLITSSVEDTANQVWTDIFEFTNQPVNIFINFI